MGGDPAYDVFIIGGGAQGACLFDRLASAGGRRVLLCDGGDFGGGTSQASAMLLWGGLLYVTGGHLGEVARLSAARDAWLTAGRRWAEPHRLSYVYGDRPHRSPPVVRTALWLYWAASGGRRRRPRSDRIFAEQRFLAPASARGREQYEEGRLRTSDVQLILDWLRPTAEARAVNYCKLVGGRWDPARRVWHLDLHDVARDRAVAVTSRWVVNATGPWADTVDRTVGVDSSPWRHQLTKGASLCLPRPAGHGDTLVFDAAGADEGCSLVPWGPVSIWGSTEDAVATPADGRRVDRGDVRRLLDGLNRHLRRPFEDRDVVALRCGVRPLVVPRDADPGESTRLSKQWRVHVDDDRAWVTLYGGKITSSPAMAQRAATLLDRRLGRAQRTDVVRLDPPPPQLTTFPGMTEPVPSAGWCRQWQQCRTLDDYLRRRTNVAQWVPRGGLGRHGEHRGDLLAIAADLHDDPVAAVDAYERKVGREHDAVLGTRVEVARA